jgi:hypothetical protein
MVFTKFPHEGITSLFRFELIIYGVWRKIFWFGCKTRIIALINLSSINIRICANLFLTINTRWCKMKLKCFKFKKCEKMPQVQNNPSLKWGTYGCLKNKLWRPKQHPNQKWDKLRDKLIYVITGGGWDPIGLHVPCWCNLCIMGMPSH